MSSAIFVAALLSVVQASDGEVVEGHVLAADGVPIAYDVRGEGEATLVFVHCWACDRTFWREQLTSFSRKYRVVSLDLAGHGASGARRHTWSVTALGGDVEKVVQSLNLERVVLVGHSMGGPVALEAARRMPGRVIGVVAVDTLHDVDKRVPRAMVDSFVKRFRADFKGTMAEFVRGMFTKSADPATVDWVIEKASATRRTPALALLSDFPALDLAAMLRAARVPVRCINAAPPQSPRTAVETNRKYADFNAVIVDDVGHFIMLEKPEVFDNRLAAVVETLLANSPRGGGATRP